MKLSIRYKPRCYDRPWLIKRVNGKYGQHAHMRRKEDYSVKKSIKSLKIAIQRHIKVLKEIKKAYMSLVEL